MEIPKGESLKKPKTAEEPGAQSPRGQAMSLDTPKIQNPDNATFLSKMGETWNSIFSTPARGSDQSRLDSGDISSASPTQTPTMKKYNSGGASSLVLQSEDSPDDTPSGTKEDGQGVQNPATSSSVLQTTHAPTPNTMSMGRSGSEHNQTRLNKSSYVLPTTQAPTLNTMSMGRSGPEPQARPDSTNLHLCHKQHNPQLLIL